MNDYPRTREGQLQRYARHCIHFNGVQNKTCLAGIEYSRCGEGFVCFGEVSGCEKYQSRGVESVKKQFEEADAYFDKAMVARQAILNDLRRRFKEDRASGVTAPRDISRFNQPQANYFCGQGSMACPVCKIGTLHYSRASYNGHVHARCSTKDCVAWIE